MKPFGPIGNFSCLIVLLALTSTLEAPASLMIVEGDARLSLVLITDHTIVASKDASGAEEEEVFAIDTASRSVKWRFKAKRVASVGLAEKTNAFYMFANDWLEKRDIRTGALIWSTRLDTISQQNTAPRVTLKDRWEELLSKAGLPVSPKPRTVTIRGFAGGTPNFYLYTPVLSGSTFAVFRDASSHKGCIVMNCFKDWLTFDLKTGKLLSGGSGDLLGSSGAISVFEDQSTIWSMENGKVAEINAPQGSGGVSVPSSLRSGDWKNQHSWNDRCIFEQNVSGVEQVCVFDARSGAIASFSAPILKDYQVNWVLLDEHLMRYAECMAYTEGERRLGDPWFELYNLKGEMITRTEWKRKDESWYLGFLGTTKTGQALFETDERVVSVDVPSLNLKSLTLPKNPRESSKDGHCYSSIEMARGANCFYVLDGNTTISQMTTEQRPHKLQISAVDAETGRPLWRHTEEVTIKKIKSC